MAFEVCDRKGEIVDRVVDSDHWHYYDRDADCVVITSDRDIMLHGIRHFGAVDPPYTLTLDLQLLDEEDGRKVVASRAPATFSAANDRTPADVLFDEPAAVQANRRYTIYAHCTGPCSRYTEEFDDCVEVCGVRFDFFDATFPVLGKGNNHTNDGKRGQINALLFKPGTSVPRLLKKLEAEGAHAGADAVVRDLGVLLDSGTGADVVFRVGTGAAREDVAAHRVVLAARSPVFAAMLAERWSAGAASSDDAGGSGSGASAGASSSKRGGRRQHGSKSSERTKSSSNSSSNATTSGSSSITTTTSSTTSSSSSSSSSQDSDTRCTIDITDTEPAAFKQLLRYVYTGSCEEGALGAMGDHLLGAAAVHGMHELQELSSRALTLSVTVENACDYFALAYAHDDEDLMDVCAELAKERLQEVTQSEGFQRHLAQHTAVGAHLMARMGSLASPEAETRKRKREGDE